MEIKPIQTRYKGYNFRSRLEARWAVFFDSLGVNWQYELEGFHLSDGVYYLPDFFLSDYSFQGIKSDKMVICEVKVKFDKEELDKCKTLCKNLKCDILLLEGTPDKVNYTLLTFVDVPEEDKKMLLEYDISAKHSFVFAVDIMFDKEIMIHGGGNYGEYSYAPKSMIKAVESARSKRFEHSDREI